MGCSTPSSLIDAASSVRASASKSFRGLRLLGRINETSRFRTRSDILAFQGWDGHRRNKLRRARCDCLLISGEGVVVMDGFAALTLDREALQARQLAEGQGDIPHNIFD